MNYRPSRAGRCADLALVAPADGAAPGPTLQGDGDAGSFSAAEGYPGGASSDGEETAGGVAEGSRLTALINDVLDLAKIEAGKMELIDRDVHLRPFLEGLTGSVERFKERGRVSHDFRCRFRRRENAEAFMTHLRAILGLPIPNIVQRGPAASAVLLVEGDSADVRYGNLEAALAEENTQIRLFGKPEVRGERRLGVALALAETVEAAVEKAKRSAAAIEPVFGDAG